MFSSTVVHTQHSQCTAAMLHNRQQQEEEVLSCFVLIRPVVFSISRITAALEKVELLWQQAFSQARFQLQRFQLWEEALQVSRRTRV